jgi:hypothetical protein
MKNSPWENEQMTSNSSKQQLYHRYYHATMGRATEFTDQQPKPLIIIFLHSTRRLEVEKAGQLHSPPARVVWRSEPGQLNGKKLLNFHYQY